MLIKARNNASSYLTTLKSGTVSNYAKSMQECARKINQLFENMLLKLYSIVMVSILATLNLLHDVLEKYHAV